MKKNELIVDLPHKGFLIWWYDISRGRVINGNQSFDFDKNNKEIYKLVKEREMKTDWVSYKKREALSLCF